MIPPDCQPKPRLILNSAPKHFDANGQSPYCSVVSNLWTFRREYYDQSTSYYKDGMDKPRYYFNRAFGHPGQIVEGEFDDAHIWAFSRIQNKVPRTHGFLLCSTMWVDVREQAVWWEYDNRSDSAVIKGIFLDVIERLKAVPV